MSGRVRGLLFFSGVMLTVRRWKSTSVHSSLHASPILMPVSLSSCRSAASLGLDAAISVSISSSVGMKGFRCSGVYFGLFHIFPKKLRYPVYAITACCFVLFFHCSFESASLTCSGSLMLVVRLPSSARRCMMVVIVSSVRPFFLSSQA